MTVMDMFTKEFYNKYGDIDVYDDVCEELGVAFCGARLTDKAKETYADVLGDEVFVQPTGCSAVVCINDLPEGVWQKHLKLLTKLFNDCAGYGPADEYGDYFVMLEDEPEDHVMEFVHASKAGKGYDYIANHYWEMSREDLKDILLEYIYDADNAIEELEDRE